MDQATETASARAQSRRRMPPPMARLLAAARHDLGPAVAGSVLPFALVLYLALRGGGYDSVVYGEVGVTVWWLLVLGALVGILPAGRIPRIGWVALGALALFAAWTALGIAWSESAERSAAEAGRVCAYLGVFALALAAQGRDGLRRTVNAVAAAIALVAVLALLSRLHPEWFPRNDAARLLPGVIGNRLSYPLDYWNGLAALVAMGIPLVLGVALDARHCATRAVAAATLPAMALTALYTFSRGGALATGVALVAFIVFYPRRLATLPTLAISGIGSAVLIAAATQRNALENHVLTQAARTQGDEMLAIVAAVCAGVGLAQFALGVAARHRRIPRPSVDRRGGAALAAVAVAAVVIVAFAAGLPGELVDRWTQTDEAVGKASGAERFESVSTESRQQYWESAVDANATAPLIGIGPGTFQYWWEREGFGYPARDAHSLFVETLAELGIIGLVLVGSFVAIVLVAGIRRIVISGPSAARKTLAAAVACCVAFTLAAAVDWVWEVAVLPVAFLVVAAPILGRGTARPGETPAGASPPVYPPGERRRPTAALLTLAVPALIAIAMPLAGTMLARESRELLRSGETEAALDAAESAAAIQPYAATPKFEQALALKQSGTLGRAAAAATEATEAESTNWRTWFLLSEIEAERGRAASSAQAYDRARSLNPRVGVALPGTRQPVPPGTQ